MRTVLCLFLAAATAAAQPWDKETRDLFALLPVQERGRVKPLWTVSKFALLRMNYRSEYSDTAGAKHDSLEWMLQVLLRPDEMRAERIFLVENSDVLDAIGLEHEGRKRRDRYSFDELSPAFQKLMELFHQYKHIDAKEQTPVQSQIVDLASSLMEFEDYARFLDFARAGDVTKLMTSGGEGNEEAFKRIQGAWRLAILPPVDGSAEWLSPAHIIAQAMHNEAPAEEHLAMLVALEKLASTDDPKAFKAAAEEFAGRSRALAKARGEYRKIPLEVSFYKLDPFYKALLLFVFGFVAVAVGWLRRTRVTTWLAILLTAGGLALTVTGIVIRCILNSRPPVTTLYETVPFITATGVLSALVIEWINRRRIALAAAPILGSLGLFIAHKFELIDKEDTMKQLQAVLDTNFWLATHVTCITLGYAAGLLAAAIAHVYVLGKAFGLRRGDAPFYRNIARMVYGVICFALVFSVVGTILGGVWANDSWGRFWGWDPKENGALLIVLAQLALIHGRMGGHLRDFGISMAAIFGGMVVSWSWWGVNLLGVGLHSYGFIGGVWTGLLSFWGLESMVLLAGGVSWLNARAVAKATRTGDSE
jgi:ABC-type transport system involved in cytochrome c biogenesis permease subunit